MWTVTRISSSRCGFPILLGMPGIAPMLRERLSMAMGELEEFLAVDPDRDMLDWFGDFSYHFLGRWGFQPGSGDKPRPLSPDELL